MLFKYKLIMKLAVVLEVPVKTSSFIPFIFGSFGQDQVMKMKPYFVHQSCIKYTIQRGVGWFSTSNHSGVMRVLLQPVPLCFGENKYANIRKFLTIFSHDATVSSLQKFPKITVSTIYNG